jgi:hypothetical protein
VKIAVSGIANAPTTLGNTIRISSAQRTGGLSDQILIHELTHVWQFQTRGMQYMSNSLCAQVQAIISKGDRNFAYTLTGEDIVNARSIDNLPAEKQAVFVELWFLHAMLQFPGASAPEPMRSNSACKSMMKEVQSAQPLPQKQVFEEIVYGPGRGRVATDKPNNGFPEIMPFVRWEF